MTDLRDGPDRARLEEDRARRRYLLDELAAWATDGKVDEAMRARLAAPYEAELAVIEQRLAKLAAMATPLEGWPAMPSAVMPAEGWPMPGPAMPSTVTRLAGWPAPGAPLEGWPMPGEAMPSTVTPLEGWPTPGAPLEGWPMPGEAKPGEAMPMLGEAMPPAGLLVPMPGASMPKPGEAMPMPGEAMPPAGLSVAMPGEAMPLPPIEEPAPAKAAPRREGRILRELRPVFYENLVLFLGAFLLFAGSIYFAVYFWDRLGVLGPLVAGGLLSLYGLSFAGTGYLLQRRYHADLSARVLYGVATAVLPVAATLLGSPLSTEGTAARVLAGAAVTALCAIAYPTLVTAASLFQREIGRPFARAFVAGLWAIGVAPLASLAHVHAIELAYVYLAALPAVAMYRRLREVGRVFERATVIYVVGGSAYAVAAVAARVAVSADPPLAAPELAPIAVVLAAAAIDLDVVWRRQSHAARSALGAVGVLAHATAIGGILVAAGDPHWRIVTTLAAGLVFAVTALRHRRASALHLAIATVAASACMIAWIPALDPPRYVALDGLILLPLTAGLARLAARWRHNGAPGFAAPCEQWAVLTALVAAVGALGPLLGEAWTIEALGSWREVAPALIVLAATAGVLARAWAWGHRRPYLVGAALAGAALVLVAAARIGAGVLPLALVAAGLSTALAALAAGRPAAARADRDPRPALIDAALVLLATALVLLVAAAFGAWDAASPALQLACPAAIGVAAAAVASQRPSHAIELGCAAGVAATAALALWHVAPPELIPGILALGLLALDRLAGQVSLGQARPLRDVFGIAAAAVATQAIVLIATADALATLSPIAAGLIAVALMVIAARLDSPWPSYAAFGSLVLVGYGAPAALHLSLAPRAASNLVALALILGSLALRASPAMARLRRAFLDVPLHIAALAAPFTLLRALLVISPWVDAGAPASHLLVRRFASPLVLAVCATITHGSRAHAYLAATAGVLVVPAVSVWLDLGAAAFAAALAASAVLAWLAGVAIARQPWFARPARRDVLPLVGRWALPGAPSLGALWSGPLAALGLAAAVLAGLLALARTIEHWPQATPATALAYGTLAIYALAQAVSDRRPALAIHATCAAVALASSELAHLVHADLHGAGLVVLAAAYLVAGELAARRAQRLVRRAASALPVWAIALALGPATVLSQPSELARPLAGAVLAIAVLRRGPGEAGRAVWHAVARSLAVTWAAGLVVLWLVGLGGWPDPEAVAAGALALTAVASAWAHHRVRARLAGAADGLGAVWAAVGSAFAMIVLVTTASPSPVILALAALGLATLRFGAAGVRTDAQRYGYAAELTVVASYVALRIGPLGARLAIETDVLVAVIAGFVLYFASELLQRARLAALARPALAGANTLPLVACVVALAGGVAPTVQYAVLAESLGVLYTLSARRARHPAFGALALAFYNAGFVLLWISTHRVGALYYTVPIGVSIGLLTRLYQRHLSNATRRGLRAAGALLIYFSTYYYVVQFDNGLYPVLLGGLALAGVVAGFALELRELFGLSIGFIVLDVISNLAYYGAHRPVLGWTLLTLAGLLLTASGVVFQLRRAQIRALVADLRDRLARWD